MQPIAGESDALEELRRRAAESPAPGAGAALEGEHIPRDEAERLGLDFDPQELLADTLELLLRTLAPNWLAETTPEEIRITREKVEKLSKPYLALLVKYLPGLLERFPLELAAVLQTVMILMPLAKAGVPARLPPAPAKKPDAASDAPAADRA